MRRLIPLCFFGLHLAPGPAIEAQDSDYRPLVTKTYELSRFGGQIPGPEKPDDFIAWLADIQHWRSERHVKMAFDPWEYARPELAWTRECLIQTILNASDRYLYDPVRGQYTVDRFLDDLDDRFGGVDCVILWPGYPNLGVDSRNQYDLFRDMPGGLPGLRGAVDAFHRRGVRVQLPHLPWDLGTRDEGETAWDALVGITATVGADGIYGDTYNEMPLGWKRAAGARGVALALEPQNGLVASTLEWNHMTWGEDWETSFVPSVSHQKWLEPRHMVHIARRRAQDRTDELQHAFFNGTGYVAWENIWGSWNGVTPRDGEALRRIAWIERRMVRLISSAGWEPHTPTLQDGVFASRFPGEGETLWVLVNRTGVLVAGRQLRVSSSPGTRFIDLWNGVELEPRSSGNQATLDFELDAHGYGGILMVEGDAEGGRVEELFAELALRDHDRVSTRSADWKPLPQHVVELPRTDPGTATPPGMVLIPSAEFDFQVSGVAVEGGDRAGVDFQYSWEDFPRRHHSQTLSVDAFFIDPHPVTNAEFQRFLDATGYHPRDDHNFLKHWRDGSFPPGWGEKPVTWVSIEDARDYAAWAGKRLPHEWEWQYAGQGLDGRAYPWGDEWDSARVPSPHTGRSPVVPDDVGSHPNGDSPFGIGDLVGNVWQWTDEYRDEHTRAAVLRGGSRYRPQGSMWYFPQALRLDQHGRYLLVSPGRDRSGAIGFRCVKDARDPPGKSYQGGPLPRRKDEIRWKHQPLVSSSATEVSMRIPPERSLTCFARACQLSGLSKTSPLIRTTIYL